MLGSLAQTTAIRFLWFSFLRWAVSWAKFRIGSIT
ncbi:hypothetical protein M080_8015, partial [Bacteroides fragilis str. 3397 T10]